jgi:hypothetical protein
VDYNNPSSLGSITFVQQENITKTSLAEDLKIDPFSSRASHTLGRIKLNAIDPITQDLTVEQIGGQGLPGGSFVPVPSFQESIISSFQPSDDFAYIKFESGNLELEIKNYMPVDIEIRGYRIVNELTNVIVVSNPNWITLIPNDAVAQLFPLGDKTVRNSLRFECDVFSPGSDGQLVQIPDGQALSVGISILEDYEIKEVKAEIPAQDPIVKDSSISIDDSEQPLKIQRAVVESGYLNMIIDNNFDLDILLEITIFNLKKPDGSVYSRTVNLLRKEQGKIISEPSLENWSFDNNGFISDSVRYRFTAQTFPSTGMPVITNTDSINLNFDFSDFAIKSFSGKIPPTNFQIEESITQIDIGDFEEIFSFEEIEIANPDIIFSINSPATFELLLDAEIEISNGSQVNVLALENVLIQPAGGTNISLKDYGLSDALSTFTGSFPNQFKISGLATINPNYLSGTLSIVDSISGGLDIQIPLDIGISGGSITDTVELSMGDSDEAEKLNFAIVTVELTNEIPIGLEMVGFLLDSTNSILLKLPPRKLDDSNSDTIFVEPPEIDQLGNSLNAGYVKQELILYDDEVQKLFTSPNLLLNVKFYTPPDGSSVPVNFLVDDEVQFKIYAKASYRMDF